MKNCMSVCIYRKLCVKKFSIPHPPIKLKIFVMLVERNVVVVVVIVDRFIYSSVFGTCTKI